MPPPASLNCRFIEESQRDNTQDWVVPRRDVPTLGQLEARIDEALVIARASEAGVREVGEMALDAARQARRAAEAAEASAKVAVEVVQSPPGELRPAGPVTAGDPPSPATAQGMVPPTTPPAGGAAEKDYVAPTAEEEAGSARPVRFEARFRSFSERADRVSARLQRLGAHPSHRGGSSVSAVRQRGDG